MPELTKPSPQEKLPHFSKSQHTHAISAQDLKIRSSSITKWLGMQADGIGSLRVYWYQRSNQLRHELLVGCGWRYAWSQKEIQLKVKSLSSIPTNKTGKHLTNNSISSTYRKTDLFLEMKSPKAKTQQNATQSGLVAFCASLLGKGESRRFTGIPKIPWKNLLAAKPTTLPILIEESNFMQSRETRVFETRNLDDF